MENEFIIETNHENPPHNTTIFEEFFAKKFLEEKPDTVREYIPVCWTNYYVSKNYCKDDMSDLQNYLDSLDRSKKYFTVCQWDDGIVNNVEDLDLYVFSSGGVGDYAYPLNCLPHPDLGDDFQKHILCSFVGAIKGRHKTREIMNKALHRKKSVFISERLSFEDFYGVMKSSLFALCPRGYGKTSFRICEALQLGTIPIYVYDEPWIPFEDMIAFEEYGVRCNIEDIQTLHERLCSISIDKVNAMLIKGEEVYRDYYSFDGCYNKILHKASQ